MRAKSNTKLPEHLLCDEESLDDSQETLPACSEADDNFETGPRLDFESEAEPL